MHPTIDEQLRGAMRLVGVLESGELSAEAREVLANIGRLVRQAREATLSAGEFYRQDNLKILELLDRLNPSPRDTSGIPWEVDGETGSDATRNTSLRAELCREIELLVLDTPQHADIGRYLLLRVEQDPT